MSFSLKRFKVNSWVTFIFKASAAIGFSCLVNYAFVSRASATSPPLLLAQQPNCTTPQTQQEINVCANYNWQLSNRELIDAYERLVPNLSISQRQQLVDSQLAWEDFRNAECQFYSSLVEGATAQIALEYGCFSALSRQRTITLSSYLSGEFLSETTDSDLTVENQLNKLYGQLQQTVPSYRQNRLVSAQLAWVEFYNLSCNFERSSGGTLGFTNCLVRSIEQRIRQLDNHIANLSYI
ncbi:MAG: lysozyme inhibitor LprI family protein [Cyanobacteriota bacterium]|nr:lysozyme inhibitor LprI family protein [Cyanobacteriota bacterium]